MVSYRALKHAYHEEGLSVKQVASQFGISYWSMMYNIRTYGLQKRRESWRRKAGDAVMGEKNGAWNGGLITHRPDGYIYKLTRDHPRGILKNGKRYVPISVLAAEKALGRYLKKGEVVHHINGDKRDNRNYNLLICISGYHAWLHQRMSQLYMERHLSDVCPQYAKWKEDHNDT